MRTSLLLAREPFGRIACDTLAAYWRARTGKEHHVTWCDQNPGRAHFQRRSLQAWFGNIYLNFFAVSYSPDAAFEPLRQEYIRSVSRWRRWPQRAYVHYAMSQSGRERLAQVALGVWPGVVDAHDCIIVGGNRRLRLLQPARRTTTVVLKRGFDRVYLAEDAEVRTAAGARLSCAPRIGRSSSAEGWYEEEWVSGVPVNRLDPDHGRQAIEVGHQLLAAQLAAPSLREEPTADYLDGLDRRIDAVRAVLRPLDPALEREVRQLQEALHTGLMSTGLPQGVGLCFTHGDLQPANLLWDGSTVRVIDWENCRRRLAGYDMLFNVVGLTTQAQWSRTLDWLARVDGTCLPGYLRDWPGMDWSAGARKTLLGLFLLEQLATMLEEDCASVFFQPGAAFRYRLPEFAASVRTLSTL